MSQPFIGEIRMFAGNFAPRTYAFCDGQLASIAQNNALFALLGTLYGGDGRITFGLPDLRGRIPIHEGAGPGLVNRSLASKGGGQTSTVSLAQYPVHSHPMQATSDTGNSPNPQGNVPGKSTAIDLYINETPSEDLAATAVTSTTGGGNSHANVQPFLCIHYIIALAGVFPSRNSPEPSTATAGDGTEPSTATEEDGGGTAPATATAEDTESTRPGKPGRSRNSLRRRRRRARRRKKN